MPCASAHSISTDGELARAAGAQEMRDVAQMLGSATRDSLLAIDELGRG